MNLNIESLEFLPSVTPVAALKKASAYSVQTSDYPIDLKLDANEGTLELLDGVSTACRESVRKYPSCLELQNLIADRHQVHTDQVVVTAGGDEAIDRVCRVFLQAGRNIVIPEPTFEMIRRYATLTGADVRSVAWPDGQFPVEDLIRAADGNTAIVAIVSPNNPTGAIVTAEQLRAIATALPDCVLMVDQAYAEFEDNAGHSCGKSLTEVALNDIPNAVVIRTFSKAWGLAGLRVGYAAGNRHVIQWLRCVAGPYPVAGPSLDHAASVLCTQSTGVREYIRQVQTERDRLRKLLDELGVNALPSQSNFVYLRFDSPKRSAGFVYRALAAQGISVRLFEADNALRITCPGNARDFERLQQSLRCILSPEAILFDMDGVLVNEAPSYREAIRLTCQSFGETLSPAEIARGKLCGDANNDWEYTWRLLRERGIVCEFDDVKHRFESFYQGSEASPGLWTREPALFDRAWLTSLAALYPLAVVTGRPRNDAWRFLKSQQIENLFQAVVCLEDGPAKPDPANVLAALEILGVSSAWMIGDTPDDMGAARAAGLAAFGIVAPQDDPEFATEKLKSAFAVEILDSLSSLNGYLP